MITDEDRRVIEDTVRESYELNKVRAGEELARYLADELREQLLRQHREDKSSGKAHTTKQNDSRVDPGNAG